MFKYTIELLQSNDWFEGGEYIQLAKGKYEYVSSWRILIRKIKRKLRIKTI